MSDHIESYVTGDEYAKLEAELAELKKPCVWTHSGAIPGMTRTGCGVVAGIMVNTVGDAEAYVKFCCFCQRPIQSHPITETPSDE